MRNYIIFLLAFLLNLKDGYTQTKVLSCKNLQNGVFLMYEDSLKIVIKRRNGIQKEKSTNRNSKLKVTWLSECEYDLRLIKSNNKNDQAKIGRIYHVKIIDIKKDEYTFECRVDGIDFVYVATAKKIN